MVLRLVSRLLLVVPLAACGKGCHKPPARAAAVTVQVKDDHGNPVSLPRPARRIASLSPSNTEILFAVGCGEQVVLRDRLSSYPSAARRLPATNPFQLSPEHIAGFTPDLVLLSHADSARLQALRQLGLAVAVFEPRDLRGVLRDIKIAGTLCGAERAALALATRLRRRVDRVSRRVKDQPRPSVFIETDGTDPLRPWTAGPGSFVDEMVRLAGGTNVVSHLKRPFAQVNAEAILDAKPRFILAMGVERQGGARGIKRLRRRDGWNALAAVREGRVIDDINADLLSRPGPRLVDGLEALARHLHPEVF